MHKAAVASVSSVRSIYAIGIVKLVKDRREIQLLSRAPHMSGANEFLVIGATEWTHEKTDVNRGIGNDGKNKQSTQAAFSQNPRQRRRGTRSTSTEKGPQGQCSVNASKHDHCSKPQQCPLFERVSQGPNSHYGNKRGKPPPLKRRKARNCGHQEHNRVRCAKAKNNFPSIRGVTKAVENRANLRNKSTDEAQGDPAPPCPSLAFIHRAPCYKKSQNRNNRNRSQH